MKIWQKVALAVGIVLFFLVLSYGFMPQVLKGKIVNQSDISGYIGMSHEMERWNRDHPDDPTYWTGSMFSGMPTTAISTLNKGDWTQKIYDFLLLGKRPASFLFIALLGAFLLMLSLGIDWVLALGGAVAIAFCSYNFQIIQVGHNTKMQAIAFMPWVLAALVFTYRSAVEDGFGGKGALFGAFSRSGENWLAKTVLGAVLFALAVSLQVKANHQQVTYYLAILVLLYALAYFIDLLRSRKDRLKRFFIASGLLLVIGLVGVATNVNKLLPLYKYQQHTMRGGSELSGTDSASQGGLDLNYATAWSYGWEELPNLMIPDFNGGSSSASVNPDKSATIAYLRGPGSKNLREKARHLPMYWGPQPFTAGPMYMGAISVFLFILGLCLYKGKEKGWLLVATLLAILMAVGNHFMVFTKLCFRILPLYNKFRTVSMALVILQLSLPILGFLVLDRIVKEQIPKKEFMKGGWIAFALTGGICLLFWLLPSLAGNFSAPADAEEPALLQKALSADRRMLLRHDALLSFFLIAASWLLLVWSYAPKGQTEEAKAFAGKGRKWIAGTGICVLILINLFTTGKRYLNDGDFTTQKDFRRPFAERPVDKIIQEDPALSYRVMDLSVSVFNSSVPSYRYKSIGGYSPAKLQRYQDLIDHYLVPEISSVYESLGSARTVQEAQALLPAIPVLNALNTKYIILGGEYAPLVNGQALGNAWFVSSAVPAEKPDAELALIGSTDLRNSAVAATSDISLLGLPVETSAEDTLPAGDSIALTAYAPNELHYHYTASAPRTAVFSEVFYPGWTARLENGEPLNLVRADWILRAAALPAGDHDIVMRFEPTSYKVGERISRTSSITLLVLTLLALAKMALPRRKERKEH